MDNILIANVLQGDKQAFNELIELYYNELFKFVYNQTSDIELTKDLTQEIFMRIYTKLHTFNSKKASFRTWMYRVSSNYLVNYFRKNKIETLELETDLMVATDEVDPLTYALKQDDISYVIMIMSKVLNKKHQSIMMMHFFSYVSVDEIASILNIAPKTVRNVISLSIKKIKEEIGGKL